jgi:CSLREA domain-containing protein
MERGIGKCVVAAAVASLLAANVAQADTFQVTKTGDSNPNGCGQGGCTLREATIAANNKNGADTIVLHAGKSYKIGIPGSGEDLSATGDFDLTEKTTVRAAGGGTATVDGNNLEGIFDAFATARFEQLELIRAEGDAIGVLGADVTVERSEITKSGGVGVRADDGDATVRHTTIDDTSSNAVYQSGTGSVKVSDSKFRHIGSSAISEYDDGNVSIEGTTVERTSSNVVYESSEGNIRFAKSKASDVGSTGFSEYDGGGVTVSDSKLEDFSSNFVYESSVGSLRVTNSNVRKSGSTAFSEYDQGNVVVKSVHAENSSSNMIYESGDGNVALGRSQLLDAGSTILSEYDLGNVKISHSKLEEGKSNGIYESDVGNVKLSSSKVSRTKSTGLTENDLGGVTLKRSEVSGSENFGVFMSEGKALVSESMVAGHKYTGLVFGASVDATVKNSTIANNGAPTDLGGGIQNNGLLTVENSTIYGNRADTGGGFYNGTGTATLNSVTVTRNRADTAGGGLYQQSATFSVGNSLVADNSSGAGPDCSAASAFISNGHNLLSDDEFCTGLGGGNDTVKGSAKTDGLKNNGGPTKTAAISANSPAVDKAGNSSPPKDQRGHDRDSKPDIGAFER